MEEIAIRRGFLMAEMMAKHSGHFSWRQTTWAKAKLCDTKRHVQEAPQ